MATKKERVIKRVAVMLRMSESLVRNIVDTYQSEMRKKK